MKPKRNKLPKRNYAILMVVGSMEVSQSKLVRICKQLGYDHNSILDAVPNLLEIGLLERSGTKLKLTERGKNKYLRLYNGKLSHVRIEQSKPG